MAADERHHGGPVIGIDLGTTNSLVAICDERGPRVLAGSDASNLLPSVVRFDPSGVVVGEEARAGAIAHARRTVTSAKRLLGRSAEECNLAGEHLSLEELNARVQKGDNSLAHAIYHWAGNLRGSDAYNASLKREIDAIILDQLVGDGVPPAASADTRPGGSGSSWWRVMGEDCVNA